MDTSPNVIEYGNCQITKKNIILIFAFSILLTVSIAFGTTLIVCIASSECSDDLFVAVFIITGFAVTAFIGLAIWVSSTWCYDHNSTYKNIIDKNNLKREISWQLDGKSKEELEHIKEYISSLSSA